MEDNLTGQFLIGLPELRGDYFQNTVGLLVAHNDEGAFGLIINRPVSITMTELFPELALSDDRFQVPVLEGGPVQQNNVFMLHQGNKPYASSLELELGDGQLLYVTTSGDLLEDLKHGQGPRNLFLVLGYAGWAPGQLESELGENIWMMAPSDTEILFHCPYVERAAKAAEKLGVDLNLMSSRPGHG